MCICIWYFLGLVVNNSVVFSKYFSIFQQIDYLTHLYYQKSKVVFIRSKYSSERYILFLFYSKRTRKTPWPWNQYHTQVWRISNDVLVYFYINLHWHSPASLMGTGFNDRISKYIKDIAISISVLNLIQPRKNTMSLPAEWNRICHTKVFIEMIYHTRFIDCLTKAWLKMLKNFIIPLMQYKLFIQYASVQYNRRTTI